jgi:hypothetical protein
MNKRIIVIIWVLLAANILLLGWWFLWGKARYGTPSVVPKLDVASIWEQNYRPGDPNARVTMNVIEEDGNPIPDVTTSFTFGAMRRNPPGMVRVTGKTDMAGRFVALGYYDQFFFDLEKSGYYVSYPTVTVFGNLQDARSGHRAMTTTSTLRKIEKPVAMYARQCSKSIPEIQKPCGFDLEIGDWVAPYGDGKVADLIMTLQREYENRDKFNVSVAINFSNPLDGIQKTRLPENYRDSVFKWPRLAPETGYQPMFSAQSRAEPGKGFFDTAAGEQAYFFRVRTVERDGRIVSALYGKIKGGIHLDGRETQTCGVAFTYYLNPEPNSRNMEFDPKHNLFTNLKYNEQVDHP